MEFGFEPVCDQLRNRTSPEPASVMEFGFYLSTYVNKETVFLTVFRIRNIIGHN